MVVINTIIHNNTTKLVAHQHVVIKITLRLDKNEQRKIITDMRTWETAQTLYENTTLYDLVPNMT